MKIIRIALDSPYNSLQPFDQEFTYISSNKNIIEPICLVGSNGSGKSNLLELIIELFFSVESDLRLIQDKSKPKLKLINKLLIEYILFNEDGSETHVKIDSFNKDRVWEISTKVQDDYEKVSIKEIETIKKILPEKVIAYSSGHNESLSYWFGELNKQYAKEVQEAFDNSVEENIEDTRLIFMDYDCNSSILLANYLYSDPDKFTAFKEFLRLEDIVEFRVFMDFKRTGQNYVWLSDEHREYIKKFEACASGSQINYINTKVGKTKREQRQEANCIFNFFIDDQTRAAIRKNFESAFELFMAFQKFELLNQLKLKGSYRKSSNKKDQLHRPPVVGHEDRIFRIEDIDLKISSITKPIPYIAISDGEHQFLQTLGTILLFEQRNVLFLLDEPETHFNPQWRRNFVSILQDKTEDRYQEIILTTHSPFIVSDCRKYNVFLFERVNSLVKFRPFDIETFGTSVDTILLKAFKMDESISVLAEESIEDILKERDYNKAKAMLERLGSSFEKMEAARHVKSLAPKG